MKEHKTYNQTNYKMIREQVTIPYYPFDRANQNN